MTEPKLHTTREERDGYRREDGKRDEPSDYFKLALVDDCNTLEDELARVRSQLNEEVGKRTQLDYLHDECIAERDRLSEELARARRAEADLDELQTERNAGSEELRDENRQLKARIAELERELAWLRNADTFLARVDKAKEAIDQGRDLLTVMTIVANAIEDHLASKPPEDWKP